MRLSARLLVVCLCLVARPVVAAPEPTSEPSDEARTAYDAGETAYRLGRFEQAASEFEQAYSLSALPEILYNIGLAHLRWYDTDPDIAHLRQAKVVFQNYELEVRKHPELGDASEVEALIAECDQKIAAIAGEAKPDSTAVDAGSDPGKPLRLAGMVTIGVGGALIVGGVIAGVVFGVQGSNIERELADLYGQAETCPAPCEALAGPIATLRADGKRANGLGVGLGLGLGGLGAVAVIAGAVLLVRGNKTKPGKLAAAPTWLPGGGGVVVLGRF
jgi:tetratricopeptide (TPR) repeat protein